ncbi:hypothetical protein KY337_05775 [Candidatus Woesearchaeota archaeon]|nr:hypothetical protein [Candidatus Woesearchaeota archaeon]
MKKLITLLLVLLVAQFVFAGVTNPLPSELQLLKGESGRFKFQIQNINKPTAVECSLELEGSFLDVEFDDDVVTVDANAISEFYGTVKAPKELGKYTQNFCVKCAPIDQASGAAVTVDSCGLPINVNVVLTKTRENMTVENKSSNMLPVIIVIIVLVVIFLLYWYMLRPKLKASAKKARPAKKKESKKPKQEKVARKKKK